MSFGNRRLTTILRAALEKQHYIALWNMYRYYPDFVENLKRYLTARGKYPYRIEVITPTGTISPVLYSHDDLLTANEIFCRKDYVAGEKLKTVVDVGANIGLSALYFLTRNRSSRCYLFEPDPRNIDKLKANLAGYEMRYFLREEAVSDVSGSVRFGIERSGRYGGIGVETGEYIKVPCTSINEVLREILAEEGAIDILKMDIEGLEVRTVKSIQADLLQRIGKIYIEAIPEERLHPAIFDQRQYGGICQLTNKLAKVGD